MTKLYLLSAIISMLIFLWLYFTDVKKSLVQHIMVIIMAISDLGYYCINISTTLSEAILANKIKYLSGCFLPMLCLFTIGEICHIYISKKIKIPLILFQLFLFGLVCTIGYSDIYYTNVGFYIKDGIGYLTKDYGPLHILYPITLYSYFSVSIVLTIFCGIKKKVVNFHDLVIMAFFAVIAAFSYLIPKVFHIDTDFSAITTLLFLIGNLYPMYHSNLFTVNENKNIVSKHLDSVCFITFDYKLRFMGCNDLALTLFKELKDKKVGKRIETDNEVLNQIINGIKTLNNRYLHEGNIGKEQIKFQTFILQDKYYESEIHLIRDFLNRCVGYTIELTNETEHHKIVELTTRYNDELSNEVNIKTEKIRSIQEKTILGFAQIVESRDLNTGGHVKRTSDVVRIFSRKLLNSDLNLTKDFLNLVIRSAPMHDLGKIGVSDAILRKNERYNNTEYSEMKKHAEIGGKMIKELLTGVEEDDFVTVAHNVANYHHEKVNGEGYPEKLKDNQIPIEARIMALADVFDALVSKRCYKEAFSYDKAFSIILESAGSHFDAELTEIFLQCRPELEAYYDNCKE